MSKIISTNVHSDRCNNNNKFWEATLRENGDCLCRWRPRGRRWSIRRLQVLEVMEWNQKFAKRPARATAEIAVIGKTKSSSVNTVEVKSIAERKLQAKTLNSRS